MPGTIFYAYLLRIMPFITETLRSGTHISGISDNTLNTALAVVGATSAVAVGSVLIAGAVTSAPVTAPIAAVGGVLAGAGATAVSLSLR
jgi:hypothetical protein